jgi:hypothetical protein
MDENNVARQYNQLVVQAQTIPFLRTQDLDVTEYVVSQALNGLFYVLGQEETKIRKDPASRTTDLLRQVFRK